MIQIIDRQTGKLVNTKTDPYFKDYEVMIGLDGKINMLQYGSVICQATPERFSVLLE